MFVQPCLIKKNTSKLRKKLEEIGYQRAKLKSDDPAYNNDKEPWILCMYDMYICLDSSYLEEISEEIKLNPMLEMDEFKHLSNEVIDCKKDEALFLETASKE